MSKKTRHFYEKALKMHTVTRKLRPVLATSQINLTSLLESRQGRQQQVKNTETEKNPNTWKKPDEIWVLSCALIKLNSEHCNVSRTIGLYLECILLF